MGKFSMPAQFLIGGSPVATRGVKAYQTYHVPIQDIKVKDRQRIDLGDIERLAKSMSERGQLQPIVIDKDLNLIAGERRLRACEHLGSGTVVARFVEDMSEHDRQLCEWDENFHRKDLDWREQSAAAVQIHDTLSTDDPEWTIEQTADRLSISKSTLYRLTVVGRAILNFDTRIAGCTNISEAYGILDRAQRRALDHEVNKFVAVGMNIEEAEEEEEEAPVEPDPSSPILTRIRPASRDILHASFHEWADSYSGELFDFVHLDPPYGLEHGKSNAGGAKRLGGYEDSLETYFKFIQTLIKNRSRLLHNKAHVMLWFSMKHYEETVRRISKGFADSDIRIVLHPLIWYKSDNTAMAPDVSREPRRLYETALMFSLGDRKIAAAVNNLFPHPAAKHEAEHLSEKPYPMLMYFFRMFIDDQTRVLDPCCGSGSSLAAATLAGAASVFGMDIDETYVECSRIALTRARLNMVGVTRGEEYDALVKKESELKESHG